MARTVARKADIPPCRAQSASDIISMAVDLAGIVLGRGGRRSFFADVLTEVRISRAIVLRALEERRVLRIVYATGGMRMIQPHAIFRKPDGSEQLEAFQVQGFTESGVEYGWKTFDLSRMQKMELGDERFEPRRDFKRVSSAFGVVVAGVRTMDQRDG